MGSERWKKEEGTAKLASQAGVKMDAPSYGITSRKDVAEYAEKGLEAKPVGTTKHANYTKKDALNSLALRC